MHKIIFFDKFMPSFCDTYSKHLIYSFYFGYDFDDKFFSGEENRNAFRSKLLSYCNVQKVKFVECKYKQRPTWSQNDAMMIAYLDDNDYFYRVNDDTIFESIGWTEAFITALKSYDPKNIGVVGPLHRGGNEQILTYDFVHKSHIDIFGQYYPKLFTDWWGDNWISYVYAPHRVSKLSFVSILHVSLPTAYTVRMNLEKKWQRQVLKDRERLKEYLESTLILSDVSILLSR